MSKARARINMAILFTLTIVGVAAPAMANGTKKPCPPKPETPTTPPPPAQEDTRKELEQKLGVAGLRLRDLFVAGHQPSVQEMSVGKSFDCLYAQADGTSVSTGVFKFSGDEDAMVNAGSSAYKAFVLEPVSKTYLAAYKMWNSGTEAHGLLFVRAITGGKLIMEYVYQKYMNNGRDESLSHFAKSTVHSTGFVYQYSLCSVKE